jgi:hypothetical protein
MQCWRFGPFWAPRSPAHGAQKLFVWCEGLLGAPEGAKSLGIPDSSTAAPDGSPQPQGYVGMDVCRRGICTSALGNRHPNAQALHDAKVSDT